MDRFFYTGSASAPDNLIPINLYKVDGLQKSNNEDQGVYRIVFIGTTIEWKFDKKEDRDFEFNLIVSMNRQS